MYEIDLRDAKAALSAIVDQVKHGTPSLINDRGSLEAEVVSFEKWHRPSQSPSLGRLLMEAQLQPDELPQRSGALREGDF